MPSKVAVRTFILVLLGHMSTQNVKKGEKKLLFFAFGEEFGVI